MNYNFYKGYWFRLCAHELIFDISKKYSQITENIFYCLLGPYLYIFVFTCHYFFVFVFPFFRYTALEYFFMFYKLIASALFFVFFLEIFLVQYLPNLSESTSTPLARRIAQLPVGHHIPSPPDRRKTAPEIRKYVAQVFKYFILSHQDLIRSGNVFVFSLDTSSSFIFFDSQKRSIALDKRIDIKKTSVKLLYTPYKIV